jgi:hypothetical protein
LTADSDGGATDPQPASRALSTIPEHDARAREVTRWGDHHVLTTNLRLLALIAVILASAALPHAASAQSADDAAAAADYPDAVVDDAAPAADAAIVEAPAPPTWYTNAQYLGRLQSLRTAWFILEGRINKYENDQRLGSLNPARAQMDAQQYGGAVFELDQLMTQISPPPQFAHVHQLHIAAAGEFDAAMVGAERWLSMGDQSGLRDAQAHFSRFDRLIGQAILELG